MISEKGIKKRDIPASSTSDTLATHTNRRVSGYERSSACTDPATRGRRTEYLRPSLITMENITAKGKGEMEMWFVYYKS